MQARRPLTFHEISFIDNSFLWLPGCGSGFTFSRFVISIPSGGQKGKKKEARFVWRSGIPGMAQENSAGCDNCYVYEKDAMYGKNASVIRRTANFDLPVKKNRRGEYKLLPQEEPVYVCMTSDFFLPEADEWRSEAWAMIKERQDLSFVIETKREHRFFKALPGDWGDGYENVTILCSVEIQRRADDRIPAFLKLPVRHKGILCEPLLEKLVLDAYLKTGEIAQVLCGGEQGADARVCDFAWVLELMNQCVNCGVTFRFLRTGTFFRKGNQIYRIAEEEQEEQARRAGVDYTP